MSRSSYVLFLPLCALLPDEVKAQPAESATYEVVFHSSWSALTHPTDFPGDAHFSGLIGATHDENVVFWMPGEPASQGIETMAERGRKEDLTAEVEVAMGEGTAEYLLSGGGINPSPGSTSLSFEISPEKPLVTLVSMVAPSPDWFVGVHGLSLIEDGEWVDTVTVTLDVYDAGTDSGPSYTSADDDTDPAEPIAVLNVGAFADNTVLGTYTFTRQVVAGTDNEVPGTLRVDGPFPNPTSGRFSIRLGATRDPIEVAVHDVTGRIVERRSILPNTTDLKVDIDISNYSSGIYVVRMTTGETVATRPVVVVK